VTEVQISDTNLVGGWWWFWTTLQNLERTHWKIKVW